MKYLKIFYQLTTVLSTMGTLSMIWTQDIDAIFSVWSTSAMIVGWYLIENKE